MKIWFAERAGSLLRAAPFLLCPLVALYAQQPPYSLTGQLILESGQPVPNAEITATLNGWNEVTEPGLTDAQGRFSLTGLPEGTFIVKAYRSDLGSFFWGQTPQAMQMAGVNLNKSFPGQDIVFKISPFATITGTVRDPHGNPLANIQVSAAKSSWGNGRAVMQGSGNASTDDLGRFRIPYLMRGRYRICASTAGEPALPVGYATFGESPRAIYSQTCLPASDSAPLFSLSPGKKLEADLVFFPQVPVVVSGAVSNVPENQGVSVQVHPMDPSGGAQDQFAQVMPDTHKFEITNVLPGQYWISAQSSRLVDGVQTPLIARIPLTVGDSGADGVDLDLQPPPSVTVVVTAPRNAGSVSVALRDAEAPFGTGIEAVKQSDGNLKIQLQNPGRYWLITRTPLCPSAARLEDAEALDHSIQIPGGFNGTLNVTFTDQCGEIHGAVVDRQGKPFPNSRNFILLTGTPADPGDLYLATGAADGSFSYDGLKPGRYYLWAWDESEEWNGALTDLASLKESQTTVDVKAGEKIQIQLPLCTSVPASQ